MHRMYQTGINLLAIVAVMGSASLAFADGGSISGKINFEGNMAKQKKERIAGDAYCVSSHKDNPVIKERYVFNYDKKTLTNVIVWVSSSVEGDWDAPKSTYSIVQDGCRYVPHVNAVQTGQKVEVKNNDNIPHNLNLKAANNASFNESQPKKGMIKSMSFNKAEFDGPMRLKCDVHTWMGAYIAVFDHPFFAVADANGEFTIDGLPAGTYEVSVWHEFSKFKPEKATIKVDVAEGATATADFTYHPPGN